MEENKFFRFLWRGNAVFLFIAGIGLIGILLMAMAILIADLGSYNSPPPPVNAAVEDKEASKSSDKRPTEKFKLQIPFNRQNAKGFTYFELRTGTESKGSFSGSSSQLRNIAVFDLNDNTTKWVFSDEQQEIEEFDPIIVEIKTDRTSEKIITRGFLLTVATSQADKSISRGLWIMSPNGEDLRKILPNIASRGPRLETYGEGQKKLIVETKDGLDVYPLDVDTLTLGPRTKISLP